MESNLYSGISYMEIEQYTKGTMTNSRRLLDHKDNLYVEQAEWYLGFLLSAYRTES